MVIFPEIDPTKCNGCGLCACVCERGGLVLVAGRTVVTVVETAECAWCAHCEAVCDTGAIRCAYEIVFEVP